MKQVLILLLISFFFINDSQAQYISIENGFLAKKYVQEGVHLRTKKQVYLALENNPTAYRMLNKTYGLRTVSAILGGIGVFSVGVGLGDSRKNNPRFSSSMLAIGLGSCLVSVSMAVIRSNRKKQAIMLYNEDFVEDTGMNTSPILNLQTTSNGIGLVMEF